MADKTVQEKASRLMADGKVRARFEAQKALIASRMADEITYEYNDAMRELDDAIRFAKQCKASGAVVAALSLKQKISGLHVEERKNNRSPIDSLSPNQVRAILETIQALKKARETSTGQSK